MSALASDPPTTSAPREAGERPITWQQEPGKEDRTPAIGEPSGTVKQGRRPMYLSYQDEIANLVADNARLQEVNQELLAAVRAILEVGSHLPTLIDCPGLAAGLARGHAAIAKAERGAE